MTATLKSEVKTKGKRVEGPATVVRVGSWMSPTGPQWENPAISFSANGETFRWCASSEYAVQGLRVGMTINIRAFAKESGDLYRVTWKIAEGGG